MPNNAIGPDRPKDDESVTQIRQIISHPITRYRDGRLFPGDNPVAVEVSLTFVVNGYDAGTLMCTPSHLKAFAYGFLFTSGMIRSAEEVLAWTCDETTWQAEIRVSGDIDPSRFGRRAYTSGCGKGVMYPDMMAQAGRAPVQTSARFSARALLDAMDWLLNSSGLHLETGGVHSAAVSIGNRPPEFHIDDIGRHNTVDKIIGTLLLQNAAPEEIALISTGRISSEIIHKTRQMGIPVIVSRGAPTHQGIRLAQETGITVVGFARPGTFTIFTHPDRIVTP